jgi:anti-sigma regulatory factor (Ser/Thr protein kinase)
MASHEISVEPDISAIPPLLEWVEGRCREDGLADDATFKMALILEEAVTNVINYAFADLPPPHMIRVKLDIAIERIIAEVVDNGRPFDPLARAEPDLSRPIEERDPGGLGILLMRRMTDRIEYRRSNGDNRLLLEKARP